MVDKNKVTSDPDVFEGFEDTEVEAFSHLTNEYEEALELATDEAENVEDAVVDEALDGGNEAGDLGIPSIGSMLMSGISSIDISANKETDDVSDPEADLNLTEASLGQAETAAEKQDALDEKAEETESKFGAAKINWAERFGIKDKVETKKKSLEKDATSTKSGAAKIDWAERFGIKNKTKEKEDATHKVAVAHMTKTASGPEL